MGAAIKQDSNGTGVRFAVESTLGVLPGSPVWNPVEPNSYKDFGAEEKTVARQPINRNRQRKKGVTVDRDVSFGLQVDATDEALQALLPLVMLAAFRTKDELAVADVDGTGNEYSPASGGAGYVAGDLLFAKGFDSAANNGLKVVTGTPGATSVPVTDTGLVDGATQSGVISRVGFQFASGDAEIDVTGGVVSLLSTTKDMTVFGLTPGEWLYIGGDSAGTSFATAANNGFARVKSIAANAIVLDKTEGTAVTDAGTGKTLRVFFGRVLKNEAFEDAVEYSSQWERTLGKADDTDSNEQAEYAIGVTMDEANIAFNTADKITLDVMGIGTTYETKTEDAALKSGARPTVTEGDVYNSTSHVRRIGLSVIGQTTPLFAHMSDIALSVKNNVKPNKAIGTLGAFSQSIGILEVSCAMTAYFTTLEAVAAIRDNDDVSLDMILAQDNKGWAFDVPLCGLGDGRLKVSLNDPITLPITADAGAGGDYDVNMDHSVLFCFFDYLPDAAMPA